jgi:hypothetical protein
MITNDPNKLARFAMELGRINGSDMERLAHLIDFEDAFPYGQPRYDAALVAAARDVLPARDRHRATSHV